MRKLANDTHGGTGLIKLVLFVGIVVFITVAAGYGDCYTSGEKLGQCVTDAKAWTLDLWDKIRQSGQDIVNWFRQF
jgi:hypothetical protein